MVCCFHCSRSSNVEFFEQLQHVGVSPKEDVQPGFVPVTVFILPGGDFTAQYIPTLVNDRRVACIYQILGTRLARLVLLLRSQRA